MAKDPKPLFPQDPHDPVRRNNTRRRKNRHFHEKQGITRKFMDNIKPLKVKDIKEGIDPELRKRRLGKLVRKGDSLMRDAETKRDTLRAKRMLHIGRREFGIRVLGMKRFREKNRELKDEENRS